MTEYETDPQRRPEPADAEPSHPTAGLPRFEPGQSDSAAVPPASSPGTPTSAAPGAPTSAAPAGYRSPSSTEAASSPPAPQYAPPGSTPPASTGPNTSTGPSTPASAVPAGPSTPGGYSSAVPAGQAGGLPGAGYPGQPVGRPGYPPVAGYPAGPYQGGPWQQPGNQGGHGGYPSAGGPGGPNQPPYPGQPMPAYPGQPQPPWGQPPVADRPSRAGRIVGAGAIALVLMLGSGVAGGALALALDDGSGSTRTYSAAPILDSADLPKIAASAQDSVVSISTGNGEGSGVILSADGFMLTNNHVVATAGGETVRVVFANGRSAQAKIVGTDPKTDLAVIKAEGVSDLKAAKLGDSDAMQVGDTVLALGSPLGLQGSVTAGILSARDRTIQAGSGGQQPQQQPGGASSISGLLQTDAPINPGNSGGALVNTRGEVIGINTAIATAGQGTGNIGVGFAIPSNKAKDVAEKLRRGEKISHPSLGVSVTAAENGGALVREVVPGSPAEKAGLQQGDVILNFGGKPTNDSNDLVAAVQAGKVGDRVEVEYQRNGTSAKATVTLAETS